MYVLCMIYNCTFFLLLLSFYALTFQIQYEAPLSLTIQLCSPKLSCPPVTIPREKPHLIFSKVFRVEWMNYPCMCLLLLRITAYRLKG